ncbi:helix-turn-helix domain-containing protein [Faecalicatena contorta]|uniref:helix-turn-helix domain-containing protein n=1 Tax=Faecalicatena contorta TaxID=39482 RepID=UPI0022854734|nr:helix-turn-helix domain-containing protein [Faecalicatena contorta]
MDYACSLLQYSGRSITEILVSAGFDSPRTFNRVFHERFHMSPREYRKMCKEED